MLSAASLQGVFHALGLNVDIRNAVVLTILIFGRVTGALLLVPFIGGPSVPGRVRMGFAGIVTAVLLMNTDWLTRETAPPSILFDLALLVKEILVGVVLGFIAQIVFYGVQIAGILIDTQRGVNQVAFLAPQLPGNVSALGNLKFQAALVLFVALNGHLIFLRSLAESFEVLPAVDLPKMHSGITALADQVAHISGGVLLIGVRLAAPVMLALFLVEVAFACIGKAASRIRIGDDAHTAKSLVGIALLAFAIALIFTQLEGAFAEMLRQVERVTQLLA